MKKDDIVLSAKQRFNRAREAYGVLRRQAIEDTRFVLGDSDNNWQWPDDVYGARAGLQRKPCLTINITAQHCKQIENQIRQNRPSAKVVPVDGGADVKTAEIYGGMLRSIQSYSNADTAHDIAAKHSIYGGEGFWRVLTEYESATSFDQVITIKPLVNPQLVYIDPDAIEPDRSDAKWCLIFEDIPRKDAEYEYGDRDDEDNVIGLSWADDGENGWVSKDTIRRAEYFWCEEKTETLLLLVDGSTVLKSEAPPLAQVLDKRETVIKKWMWARIVGGRDDPEEVKDWPGSYMPVICVVGDETNVNGQIIRKGLVRDLKDSARMVNYSYSAAVETVALQTKTPWLAAAEAIEGYEDIWAAANVENRSFMPWNAFDDAGQPLPKPERVQPAQMATAQVQMLQLSVEQARAASGQQNANFGIKSEAQSGIGIQRLKAQGEIATFNFPDNLARALKYEATVVLDLIPKIYDRKRIIRILGLDGTEKKVLLDPQHQGEAQDLKDQAVDAIFNPTAGRYDVAIDTGPSYQTQRQEAADALGELASRAPILMNAAPDLVVKAMDFQGASEIAERLAKTVDPQLRDDSDDENKVNQLVQELQRMQAQDQQLQGVIENMQNHIDQLEMEKQAKVIETQGKEAVAEKEQVTDLAKNHDDHSVAMYKAETERMNLLVPAFGPAEVQALVKQLVQEALSAPSSAPAMDSTGELPGLGE